MIQFLIPLKLNKKKLKLNKKKHKLNNKQFLIKKFKNIHILNFNKKLKTLDKLLNIMK